MTQKPSVWIRIKHFISPPRESYDSRKARPDGSVDGPGNPVYEATDRGRHGGTMDIGAH